MLRPSYVKTCGEPEVVFARFDVGIGSGVHRTGASRNCGWH